MLDAASLNSTALTNDALIAALAAGFRARDVHEDGPYELLHAIAAIQAETLTGAAIQLEVLDYVMEWDNQHAGDLREGLQQSIGRALERETGIPYRGEAGALDGDWIG
jgi:hypothetical protein